MRAASTRAFPRRFVIRREKANKIATRSRRLIAKFAVEQLDEDVRDDGKLPLWVTLIMLVVLPIGLWALIISFIL